MIDLTLLDDDFLDYIVKKIKLYDNVYTDILKLRLVNTYYKIYIDKLFSELVCRIDEYYYSSIPQGCHICNKLNENNLRLKTDNLAINPLSINSPYLGYLYYCNNAYCYFTLKKCQIFMAKKQAAKIYCNKVIINNNTDISIKIKRPKNKITENIIIPNPNVIYINNNIKVTWYELNDSYEKYVDIDDLISLNPHLEKNNKPILNPFDKFYFS